MRNSVGNATRKLEKEEQKKVATHCRKNPKMFWKYINSKRQIRDHIGDLKTQDKDGNMLTARTDFEKAEVLGNFFASVFNRESEFAETSTTQPRPCQFSSQDPVIRELIILKKQLNNLNVTKSPGPDNIHPRILYELRYELAIPLKILFETAYNLGQLPADWKTGNITASFKKGNKSNPSNYRPISLTSTICKVIESIIRDHIMISFFKITTYVKISSGLLRTDPLHYNCYALWMNGQHS